MKVTKFVAAGLLGASLLIAPAANAATVVNVDGTANASTNGSNPVVVALGAGTYNLSFTSGLYDAFSRFSGSAGCDSNGQNCSQGFENSIKYVIDGITYSLGDGAANGGIGPINPGDAYYNTAQLSLAKAAAYSAQFTLAAPGNVSFYIFDDFLGDNRGGISLAVSAVPEPGTWAMMLVGFGAIGATMRRRRRVTAIAQMA